MTDLSKSNKSGNAPLTNETDQDHDDKLDFSHLSNLNAMPTYRGTH